MTYCTPITDADLHAYVDGQLSPTRQKEIEEYLASHPEDAARVKDYQRVNEGLQQLYNPVLEEPIPAQLTVRPSRKLLRVAAISAWLSIGAVIGWSLNTPTVMVQLAGGPVQQDLVKPAAFAHEIYSVEVHHPVEVTADHEQHLVKWLSKRLHTEIHAPSLVGHGFKLIGGRLLPSTNRMAAQFMYEREDGMRLTMYARRGAWKNNETSFRIGQEGSLTIFYWIDGPMGYALVGELNRDELMKISNTIYQQIR